MSYSSCNRCAPWASPPTIDTAPERSKTCIGSSWCFSIEKANQTTAINRERKHKCESVTTTAIGIKISAAKAVGHARIHLTANTTTSAYSFTTVPRAVASATTEASPFALSPRTQICHVRTRRVVHTQASGHNSYSGSSDRSELPASVRTAYLAVVQDA